MTYHRRRLTSYALLSAVALVALVPTAAAAQSVTVDLSPDRWDATDSVRSETYLGRPSLYIDRGVALARGVALDNGTIEYDVAASTRTSFLGLAFRARTPRFSEIILLRPNQSGTVEAVQYAPAFNNVAAAWQVYHGPGYNAVATIARERWVHVRIVLDGLTARVFVDTATAPTLVVPQLAPSGGNRFGVWVGAYGRGAYFSNIRYTPSSGPSTTQMSMPAPRRGVITHWQLSDLVEPAAFTPSKLPRLETLRWQSVDAEPQGFVLVNRYYEQPNADLPFDRQKQEVMVDSIMTGTVAGSRIVYARTTLESRQREIRCLHFEYSDGVVIYLNGRPVAFAMNPAGLRDGLGIMARAGDAVYLPLEKGHNELVFAVIEFTGGWAFGARLDPP